MTGTVLKLSYNNTGNTSPEGGICGSFFFIKKNIAATAYHVLNKNDFKPNTGFKYCQFWLIVQPNNIFPINKSDIIEFPEIDTAFIKIEEEHTINARECDLSDIPIGTPCYNEGFVGNSMPRLNIGWTDGKLTIVECIYDSNRANGDGIVLSKKILDVKAKDITFNNVKGIETSYAGVVGMSGGPLINKENDYLIGMMSMGLPPNVQIKTTLFAVDIKLLLEKLYRE